jgi:hypothetical protein
VTLVERGQPVFGMFDDLPRKYDWALPLLEYSSVESLLAAFERKVVAPALDKARGGEAAQGAPLVAPIRRRLSVPFRQACGALWSEWQPSPRRAARTTAARPRQAAGLEVAARPGHADATSSAASDSATATPAPTRGFEEIYKDAGGTGAAGCAMAGGGSPAGAAGLAVAMAVPAGLGLVRRRRRAAGTIVTLVLVAGHGAARAAVPGDWDSGSTRLGLAQAADEPPAPESPRRWNFELRLGPYYPDTDTEFTDRGQAARPFAEVFGTHQGLMSGLEIDRHVSHRGGTWAIGVGAAYYSATAAALSADQTTRTGGQTSLRLVPLTVLAVYRADLLRTRYGWPLIPYAKLGLGAGLWWLGDTSQASATAGVTFGWNAAAGVSLDLAVVDAEAVRTMDQETGVNQFAIFFEVLHSALDGFGASSVLRVGDTTWIAGLMMEM